jgi:hypothetical protein
MKKLSALVLTLIAVLAVGGIVANAAKKEKVKSKVTLKFTPGGSGDPYDPYYYEEATFRGKVSAKGKASKKAKKKCKKGRTVVIRQVGGGKFGQDKTNKKGKYSLSASDAYNAPGNYKAKVKKKKKGKIVCKAAKSKTVEAF